MKWAVIDLGTNTFHLLMAEVEDQNFRVIQDLKIPVRIGQGGISKGLISPEAQDRGLKTLREFRQIMEDSGVENWVAIATSAFRNAANGSEFVGKILEETGIEVEVIPGDREAQFIFQGVKLAIPEAAGNFLVMDIGGGSVEFILANPAGIVWKRSFELGAQRLMDGFHQNDPITPQELDKINQFLASELVELWTMARDLGPITLVGSSGTFDTLVDIIYLAHQTPKSPGSICFEISRNDFASLFEELTQKKRAERAAIPGMVEMRVDMIVVAVCLIRSVIENLPINQQIMVSSYALKEGVLAQQIQSVN